MIQNAKIAKPERIKYALQNPLVLQRELNNRSLHSFLEWIWSEITEQPFVDNWHLKYLCGQLEKIAYRVGGRERKKNDLIVNISQGTTKTVLISVVFPIWCWTKWSWMKFITASYSGQLALDSAELSRELVRSDKFRAVYPDIDIKPDSDTKTKFVVRKRVSEYGGKMGEGIWKAGGYRFSTSVGGTLTGYHGDILIWDDPLNPEQAASDKELEKASRWIDTTLPSRKTIKANSTVIGIMQRLHADDVTGHLLAKKKENLKHICLPGEIKNFKVLLKPKKLAKYYKDDLFDVNRMDWEVLKDLEIDLGQFGYAGQIGQHPVPLEGGMFHVGSFQFTSEVIPPNHYVKRIRYWDKAGSEKRDAAFTTGVLISKLRDGNYIIDDVKRGKWRSDKREQIIKQTAEADGYDVAIVVEQEPGSGGLESAQATIKNLAGYRVYADRPTGQKDVRADPFSVMVNNGSVKLRTAMWNRDYIEEARLFPNAIYKDQIDASAGGFNFITKKRKARALGSKRRK